VKEDILKLLIEQNFIQVDDHTIACLHLPVKDQSNTIQIIEISQNNLVKREIDEDI
jgi:phosphotransferase system IIB component